MVFCLNICKFLNNCYFSDFLHSAWCYLSHLNRYVKLIIINKLFFLTILSLKISFQAAFRLKFRCYCDNNQPIHFN
jgi:hypothetical protein